MRLQLSLELLLYISLAGLSFVLALAGAERTLHAYHIANILRFNCIATLTNASLACV